MGYSKKEYDSIPVASCKHCHNIDIRQDEFDNDICMKCGSVNELKIYDDIHEYLEAKEDGFIDESN
jgi:hypothetical protein